MHRLSSIPSDPLSQLHQFNWSPNPVSSNTQSSPPPTNVNTSGSSALLNIRSTSSHQSSLNLSPIGSHFLPSDVRPLHRQVHPTNVGGSAELLTDSVSHCPSESQPAPERRAELSHELHSTRPYPDPGPGPAREQEQTVSRRSHSVHPTAQLHPQLFLRSCSSPSLPQHPSVHSKTNPPSATIPTTGSSLNRVHGTLSASSNTSPLTRSPDEQPSQAQPQQQQQNPALPRSTTTLWMGDLESWMDEDYVRRCVVMMGWHLPHYVPRKPTGAPANHDLGPNGANVKIKMVSGASPSSAYCFLTYPDSDMAEAAWRMISNMPPTLMPGCERTFKLNWATGLPGVQPTWDREFSVFIRDLDREVTEGELVSLFTCNFPSTKSAKIMGDLSTGLSRGYAFIRFGEECDMHRALALGRSKNGTGMYLRGRCIKISEASGSSGTAGDHAHHRSSLSSATHGSTGHQNFKARQASTTGTSGASAGERSEQRPKPATTGTDVPIPGSLSSARQVSRETPQQPLSVARANTVPNSRSNNNPGTGFYPQQVPFTSVSVPRSAAGAPGPFHHSSMPLQVVANQVAYPIPTSLGGIPTRPMLHTQHISYGNPGLTPVPPAHPSMGSPNVSQHPASMAGQATSFAPTPVVSQSMIFPAFNQSPTRGSLAPLAYASPTEIYTPAPATPFHSLTQFYHPFHPTIDSYISPVPSPVHASSSVAHFTALAQIAAAANHAHNDPSNTTVFVGGLPACISEETLKVRSPLMSCYPQSLISDSDLLQTFFQNFGEITYVKIPPNKGCGFVQYVRRIDAEQAMMKMHDFPIHGKSRIRLSWGRSLGDKQVEYVKKLSTALGISFESVWKIVQGQDHSTIKQIASAVGSSSAAPSPGPLNSHSCSPLPPGLIPQPVGLTGQEDSRLPGLTERQADRALQSIPLNLPQRLPNSESISKQPLPKAGFLPLDQAEDMARLTSQTSDFSTRIVIPRHQSVPTDFGRLTSSPASESSNSASPFHSGALNHTLNSASPQAAYNPGTSFTSMSARRATVLPSTHLLYPTGSTPSTDRARPGSIGSNATHEDYSIESLEAKWAGLGINTKHTFTSGHSVSQCEALQLSSRSAQLGRSCRGFLDGLAEEEEEREEEDKAHEFKARSPYSISGMGLSYHDILATSPPSLTHSSSQTNSQVGSGSIGGESSQRHHSISISSANGLTQQTLRPGLREVNDPRGVATFLESPTKVDTNELTSWERRLSLITSEDQKSMGSTPAPNSIRLASFPPGDPLAFESLDKFWKSAI